MNQQLKTILLTILSLSCFVIALVEVSGISSTALFNKYGIEVGDGHRHDNRNQTIKTSTELTQEVINTHGSTTMAFDSTTHDFGTVEEGEKVRHSYIVTNTGTNPLIITDVVVSCGCTVPNYNKEPILPGKTGEIEIEFNSNNRVGKQSKNILVHSNAVGSPMSINFTANVVD